MNVAIFLPNWIGDVVMATPALRALRQRFAGARLIAVGRPYVADVLAGLPWFDAHLYLDRTGPWAHRWPTTAWQLRRQGIDLAVLMPNSFRSSLVAWLSGAKRRIGFQRDRRGWMLSERLQPIRDDHGAFKPSPIIDDYNRIAQAAGCPDPGYRMELATTPSDESAADAVYAKFGLTQQDDVICLNPGAAFGAAKFWPTDSFARLAQDLVAMAGVKVLVLCGPSEREQARSIARLANRAKVYTLADEPLSLGLTKALIRRTRLLVTTDSGPRHFAAAFDRPVVSLFGPTFIDWTRTYFAKEIMLQKPVPCGPCQQRVCPTDHACMRLLTPREVLAAAQRALEGSLQKAC
ncbi:MAG: lipopolysaccharide heptosyltransferase II [Planctomycetes bacterium]|nr:lipopolysaccharide heptosyltransferase II [Planctomycetota bacterium]